MEYTIDAKGKILGRLASEVAKVLIGKSIPSYRPNRIPEGKVRVFNTDKVAVTGRKSKQKLYRRHSGYIGNLKEETLEHMMLRDSRKAFLHAVSGMLPKNKLRKKILKNLSLYRKEIN